jgi:hypothetical protein
MASTITAGNATNGLALSCDNTGILELKTGTGAGTTALTLDASQVVSFAGNVGIGTSSPVSRLNVSIPDGGGVTISNTNDSHTGNFNFGDTSSNSAGRISYDHFSNAMRFDTAGSERARIDSSGTLLVGTTSGSFGGRAVIQNNGTTTQPSISCINSTGSGTMRQIDFFTGSNTSRIGSIESTTSTTAYNTSSDYRLKNTIAPMTGALAKVSQLKPVTYKWNIDGSNGQGFIAHELAEVVPECVSGQKDAVDANGNPEYQGIDTSFLVATLTAAIQEQQVMIEELKAKVAALEGAA